MVIMKKILIINGNGTNAEVLRKTLSDRYIILDAVSCDEALEILRERENEISLLMADVSAPGMEGYSFVDQIKADKELALIPVIITNTDDSEEAEEEALSYGVADFVSICCSPEVIRRRTAGAIRLHKTVEMINDLKYDKLTGLCNKEYFYNAVDELLQKNPDCEWEIVCSNVENFKVFNNVFGTSAGDELLRQIASLYLEHIDGHGICGRINADRFVCVHEYSDGCSETFLRDFGIWVNNINRTTGNVIMKWGIYKSADISVPAEQLCERGFAAADSIRGVPDKVVAVYDDNLRNRLNREKIFADNMESALEEGQFTVFLQPKYRLGDDKLVGAEALVRWNHPEYGLMSPGEFIPLFEKNGFITKLDQYIWDRVCAMMRQWQDRGYPVCPVSVNISRADIYQTDVTGVLLELMRKYDIAPGTLHLEITESAYTENSVQLSEVVKNLKKQGFIIEIDNFGRGCSSLSMLNQMEPDVMKLDMEFIQSESSKPADEGIMRVIIELARCMGLTVVAEGVETKEQLERLREIGCDYVQGYLFARPMPCDAFEELLAKQRDDEKADAERTGGVRFQRQSILIMDDDDTYIKMAHEAFGSKYRIIEAADVKELADAVSDDDNSVAAVVLSMTMPDNQSFDALNILRDNQRTWRIPVLASAPQDALLEEKVLDMDADDFTCKPYTVRILQKRIARLLGLKIYQERERKLKCEANHDYLTGLLNRRGLQAAVNELEPADMPLAYYIFDLDGLKKVNDTAGHKAGDEMLKAFGKLLKEHTRDADVLSRYGGDEFVVILKRVPTDEIVLKKGREICQAFAETGLPAGLPAACSAGAIRSDDSDADISELIAKADSAMYFAKKNSKGNCCMWDPDRMQLDS